MGQFLWNIALLSVSVSIYISISLKISSLWFFFSSLVQSFQICYVYTSDGASSGEDKNEMSFQTKMVDDLASFLNGIMNETSKNSKPQKGTMNENKELWI